MGIDRSNLLLPGLVTLGNQGRLGGARSSIKDDIDFQRTTEATKLSAKVNAVGAGLAVSTEPGVRGLYNQLKNYGDQQNTLIVGKAKQALYAYVTQKNQPKQDAQEQVARLLGVDYYV